MREEGSIKFIKIGGTECSVRVKYKHVFGFYKAFNKELKKFRKNDIALKKMVIPNEFFFTVVWKCLDKSGIWPMRKPFRSKRHMSDSLLYDELPDVVQFVSRFVLDLKAEGQTEENCKKKEDIVIQ